jgi:dihydrofolate reductase
MFNPKMKPLNYKLIVAYCNNMGIGYKNKLPWHFKSDLKFFNNKTSGSLLYSNAIIGGYNTYMSLPNNHLFGRANYCLTSKNKFNDNVHNFDCPELLEKHIYNMNYENIWIIGGQQVYNYYLNNKYISSIYATHINNNYQCDTFFPNLNNLNNFKLIKTNKIIENNTLLQFNKYHNNYYLL